jgi:hypothetical protein
LFKPIKPNTPAPVTTAKNESHSPNSQDISAKKSEEAKSGNNTPPVLVTTKKSMISPGKEGSKSLHPKEGSSTASVSSHQGLSTNLTIIKRTSAVRSVQYQGPRENLLIPSKDPPLARIMLVKVISTLTGCKGG